jgi:hypothetical protein
MKKLKRNDIKDIEKVRRVLLEAVSKHCGDYIDSRVVLCAFIEVTVDTAMVLSGKNKARALDAMSDMINVLMERKYK